MTIATMQQQLGWTFWPLVVGLLSCLLGMGASLLGFWMSTVRMLYSMANKNFLPQSFCQGKQKPATDSAQCFPADSLFDFYRTAELF